jgi:chemotaxis protein CheD
LPAGGSELDAHGRVTYHLEPGYIYFSRVPAVVRTVLGSCVAICLWDRRRSFGGINHFLYPFTKHRKEATPKFGNVAVSTLLRIMEEAGSLRSDLRAQIYGGGYPEGAEGPDIGAENVRVARRMLNRKGIRIVSEDVGGNLGRKIVFDTASGHVAVLKVGNIRKSDWHP